MPEANDRKSEFSAAAAAAEEAEDATLKFSAASAAEKEAEDATLETNIGHSTAAIVAIRHAYPSNILLQIDSDDDEEVARTNVVRGSQILQAPFKIACLLVLVGPSPEGGRIYALKEGRTFAGRSPGSDIRIIDDGISRRHAQLTTQNSHVEIEDLHSANGTTVNNVRVSQAQLRDGDNIGLGPNVLLRFTYMEESIIKGASAARPADGERDKIGSKALLLSTFISYGGPDEPFARKLNEALQQHGVLTFFFPDNAVPGERIHRTVRKEIQEHERVILICSRASLDRKGVITEIEETLSREYRDGADYLIPIRLDDYVLTDWKPKNPDLAQAILDRVVADFEGAHAHEERFQVGVRKLIAALKK